MSTLQSMIGNLTLPYLRGAYVQEIQLASWTDHGLTDIIPYELSDYAIRYGIPEWDIQPVYLVMPLFNLDDEYLCLSFNTLGWPPDKAVPKLMLPPRTPANTPFLIPLDKDITGLTRITGIREWPEPPPDAPIGRERWKVLALVGNLGRLLWVLSAERARLEAIAQEVSGQRILERARGFSLDLIGQELKVPRGFPSAYEVDPATIALYHLDDMENDPFGATTVGDRVIDQRGHHHGTNEDAERGAQGRFFRAFRFRSGVLPRPNCATEDEFQQLLRSGEWDAEAGDREVRFGPYRVYGYREGAIEVTGPDGQPHAVWVNDEAEDPTVRGMLTTVCYGFIPKDLNMTIKRFQELGHSVQQAIDYFGRWWGRDAGWFTDTYKRYNIDRTFEACPFPDSPLTYVRIPNHREFIIGRDSSFAIEAFIFPQPTDDMRLRVIAIQSHELFYSAPMPVHCVEGWALTMGTFNCIPNNLAFSISDMADHEAPEYQDRLINVIADLDLGDGQWHHVAAVIDRHYQVARLYVDGVERGCQSIQHIGALHNDEDILIGINDYHFDAPFDGRIDEVRFSNVARRSFHPALGESDGRYRTRLSIYRPWIIPTYDNMRSGLRHLLNISPFGPELPVPMQAQIDIIERDSVRVCAEQRLRILPMSIPLGRHIDLEGDRQSSESDVCGQPDEHFFEWQLVEHNNPSVSYGQPFAHLMQLAASRSLDTLEQLLQPWLNKTGELLEVLSAYEPGSSPLAQVGRELVLHLEGMPAGVLAAFAHKACFDWVSHDSLGGGVVIAAVREEREKLEIITQQEVDGSAWPARGTQIQLETGSNLDLRVVRPALPDARGLKWLLIECGPGRARLEMPGPDNTYARLVPLRPGEIIVKVEYTWAHATISGQRTVRIIPDSLPPCESIGLDGALGVSEEEAAGKPEGYFHETFLRAYLDSEDRIEWKVDASAQRVQRGVEERLNQLLARISALPEVAGKLQILEAYDPSAADLRSLGRKLMLSHTDGINMPLGHLAALAHAVGFSWVSHPAYPGGIFVAIGPEPPLEITASPLQQLAPNAAINWAGILRANIPEAQVIDSESFDSAEPANYHNDPDHIDYTTDGSHYMTPALQNRLNELIELMEALDIKGLITVVGAYESTATNRRKVGMALMMRHETISLDRLGALAYQAGFDYVKHDTTQGIAVENHLIYASTWRDVDLSSLDATEAAEIVNYGLLDLSNYAELPEGGVRQLCLRTEPLTWVPPALDPIVEPPELPPYQAAFPAHAYYDWCLVRYGAGLGRLDSPPEPACKLVTAQRSGVVGARGEFVLGDATEPYGFALTVQPDAHGQVPPLPKAVYDDLMNFLAFRHPVGVEGRTQAVRQITPMLMDDDVLRDANTERTYPVYRQHKMLNLRPSILPSYTEVPCDCPDTLPGAFGPGQPQVTPAERLVKEARRALGQKRAV